MVLQTYYDIPMEEKPASEQIDDIIKSQNGWKAEILIAARAAIGQADPDVVEEIKWRMATRPQGLAVWSHAGILCFAEIWKDNIKLIFPKGALLNDPAHLFNARLKSDTKRAIEFREGDAVNGAALGQLVHQAVEQNTN